MEFDEFLFCSMTVKANRAYVFANPMRVICVSLLTLPELSNHVKLLANGKVHWHKFVRTFQNDLQHLTKSYKDE